jgi:ABC-type multidrug transport system fused ATPase/permease subunit
VISIIRQLYELVLPSGKGRLARALLVVCFQAIFQTLAVFSLAPFLSAAADIGRFRNSAAGHLFESAFGNGTDRRLLLSAALTSLVLLIGGNLFTIYAEVARSRYAQAVGLRLRGELLRALLARRYTWFLGINSSILTKYLIEDVSNVALQVLMPVLDIMSRVLLVILLAVSVMFFEPWICLAGVFMIAAYYVVVMRPVRRAGTRAGHVILAEVRKLYFEVQQVLGAIKPIYATDQRHYFVKRVEQVSAAHSHEVAKLPIYSSIPRSGLEMVMFGSMIGWLVILLLTGNDLTGVVPRIGLIAIVAYRLLPSVQLIFANMGALTAAQGSLNEVVGLIREQPSLAAITTPCLTPSEEPLVWRDEIRFDRVSFSYPGSDTPALRGLSFTIAKGSRVAFVGHTGSGKSTLIDLLLGLLVPTEGTIAVDGKVLTADDLPHWRRTIGYVPQDLFLLDGTIAENIAFGQSPAELDRARTMDVLQIAQAKDFITARSARGIDDMVGERGAKLSGGQRQRLALARALYASPDTLILDEATSALDPVTERKVTQALSGEGGAGQLTVVTVAHRMSTIRDYDVIHLMDHGEIVLSGRFDQLVETEQRFRDFATSAA